MSATNPSAEVPFLRQPREGEAPDGATPRAVVGSAFGPARRDRERAAAESAIFEIAIGDRNFLPAWFLDVGAERARAVCKIEASGIDFRGRRGDWMGTGFLVSPNVLLTNHHVVNSPEVAAATTCIFNYQVDRAGRFTEPRRYRLDPRRLFLTSPVVDGLDYTFVWVEGEPGREFGFIPLDRSAFNVQTGERANIVQHPDGRPKEVALQDNTVEWQDLIVAHYTCDTQGGSSGSCVFSNTWQPFALHHASREPREGEFLNEGIRFSAIAASVETRATNGPDQAAARLVLPLLRGTDSIMGFFGALGRMDPGPAGTLERVVDAYNGEACDIDVGFWNIEWFNRRVEEKLEAVGRVVAAMNLDIWALEEVSPDAVERLVAHLHEKYDLDFETAASEPDAPSSKQTTAVMWNTRTVNGTRLEWPAEIDEWLRVHSRDFEDLGLEAVEGKVFDRYPGLFRFEARNRVDGLDPFDFFLVPLHLKAMSEGSKRRRMASQIMAAAVDKMITEHGMDSDWVIGGDYNAELASGDFQSLVTSGLVAVSGDDEADGAFSYVKGPRSLIDHVFLSANLARTYGADDFFIVAHDKVLPDYVKTVSDHRPVLVRLSLHDRAVRPEASTLSPALLELRQRLGRASLAGV